MPADVLATLRQVNDNLRLALIRLRPERTHCSSIRPCDFSNILAQLLRGAESLRRPPSRPLDDAAFETEALAFRAHLEQLKRFLRDLHLRLLAEKSRLEAVRQRLASTADWAEARKNTL
jgi:hypothetical protein